MGRNFRGLAPSRLQPGLRGAVRACDTSGLGFAIRCIFLDV